MDQYAVIGNPIKHSRSPLIHQQFAKQLQQSLEYRAIECPFDGFEACVRQFQQTGGKGLNVTLPFKEQAFALCQTLTARAKLAEAVNTLSFDQQGQWLGDNTDGAGLVHDLIHNKHLILAGMNILIIGAGGAARGIIGPLLAALPKALFISNRTHRKAEILANKFCALGPVLAQTLSTLNNIDLIINASAAGHMQQTVTLPAQLIHAHTVAYDLNYGAAATAFLQHAKALGVSAGYDGFGMLVEQAAEAFLIWRGIRPNTALKIFEKKWE